MYLASDEKLHRYPPRSLVMERRWKSKVEIAPNCPRCTSSNTKFCYYNNYSQSQPRYFCKGCRRYWTKGGSLRNVPAGGGCRKSRRTKPVRLTSCGGSSVYDDDRSHGTELATSDSSVVGSSGDPGKPDIDLAAVFAKFINRTEETNTYSDLYGSTNQNTPLNDKFFDLQTQSSTSEDGAQFFSELGDGFPSGDYIVQGQAQEFTGHDPNSFGMQNMLNDELAQDPMWSDSTTLNLSWQLQELGSYCDDQTKFSSTGYENWSIFDLPTYDIFPKP